ncbi:TetR/AcrR family transcriptional regulator [Paraglaciecola polaris]|uniref:TetR/AcrR family transcriptional regulator n=1 Tax=Paraglaciecola polaris TaxID=222814 RepID=UPI0030EE9E5C|tara:strand:- start:8998 stop:9543 length:546 start_codon:yes stop_codon:yes gene_type:complete
MSKKQQLLKAAEDKVRTGGYNNFSFRELANEIGIKSSSVHYHFPTKADLGAELARQYTDNFLANLGSPEDLVVQGKKPIEVYLQQFQCALTEDQKMCLCGLLGAETDGLPDKVKLQTQRFFEQNIQWLTQAYALDERNTEQQATNRAVAALSLLEGAMLVSKAMNDNSIFITASAGLLEAR